jgi:O-antigen/teichoic acid export membrane protein
MQDLASKTKKGLQWSAIDRFLTQGIQLAITLILARVLGPTAFGLVGMLVIFIAISNVFVDGGFTSALIRKTDRNENDFITAFYYNIIMSALCYLALYISAPYVAEFYNQNELKLLLRVLGVTVLINAFILIPRVLLTIEMDFKTQAKISIFSVIISGSTALLLSYLDYGIWALVAQTVVTAITTVILFNLFSPWRPEGKVTKEAFNYLFGFGSKLLISGLLDAIYNNLYQIIIGKKFTPAIVGQFTQANLLASVPASTMTVIIQRVTYPMFSQLQDDSEKMESAYRMTLKMAVVVIFPLMMGVALIAKPMLTILLGIEWQNAAILLSTLCLGYMLYPIHAINLNILQVKGRSDLFLKLEIIKKIIGIAILFFSIPFGVLYMCIGLTVTSYLSLIINTYYTAQLTSFTQWQQCKDLIPIWLSVMLSSFIAYIAGCFLSTSYAIQIAVNLVVALTCYLLYLKFAQQSLLQQFRSALRR